MESSKALRNNCTHEEKILWEHLKGKATGYKFRRQHSVGYSILDFYCSEKKVAVELDGAHHFTKEGIRNDRERTEFLNQEGIIVLRFTNSEVTKDVKKVVSSIINYIQNIK